MVFSHSFRATIDRVTRNVALSEVATPAASTTQIKCGGRIVRRMGMASAFWLQVWLTVFLFLFLSLARSLALFCREENLHQARESWHTKQGREGGSASGAKSGKRWPVVARHLCQVLPSSTARVLGQASCRRSLVCLLFLVRLLLSFSRTA